MNEPAIQSLGLRLLAVIVLIAANAFFVAAEFALVAARRTRIEALIRRGDRKAKTVQRALHDLYRQLSAAQLGITVASILMNFHFAGEVLDAASYPKLARFLQRALARPSFRQALQGEIPAAESVGALDLRIYRSAA